MGGGCGSCIVSSLCVSHCCGWYWVIVQKLKSLSAYTVLYNRVDFWGGYVVLLTGFTAEADNIKMAVVH